MFIWRQYGSPQLLSPLRPIERIIKLPPAAASTRRVVRRAATVYHFHPSTSMLEARLDVFIISMLIATHNNTLVFRIPTATQPLRLGPFASLQALGSMTYPFNIHLDLSSSGGQVLELVDPRIRTLAHAVQFHHILRGVVLMFRCNIRGRQPILFLVWFVALSGLLWSRDT